MFNCLRSIRIRRAALCLSLVANLASAQKATDALKSGFENPPQEARPRVWWHWMNGNITQEGIRLDLEWMHRAGVGGFQNFDAALFTPQIVDKRLVYMTPDWKQAFKYATTVADQLGLEEAIANSPGCALGISTSSAGSLATGPPRQQDRKVPSRPTATLLRRAMRRPE